MSSVSLLVFANFSTLLCYQASRNSINANNVRLKADIMQEKGIKRKGNTNAWG